MAGLVFLLVFRVLARACQRHGVGGWVFSEILLLLRFESRPLFQEAKKTFYCLAAWALVDNPQARRGGFLLCNTTTTVQSAHARGPPEPPPRRPHASPTHDPKRRTLIWRGQTWVNPQDQPPATSQLRYRINPRSTCIVVWCILSTRRPRGPSFPWFVRSTLLVIQAAAVAGSSGESPKSRRIRATQLGDPPTEP